MARGAKSTWTGGSFWAEWAKEHGTDALPPAGRKALGLPSQQSSSNETVTAGRDPAHSVSEASADSLPSPSADVREPAGGTPSLQPAGSIPASTSPQPDPLPVGERAKHASDHAPAGPASDVPVTVTEPAAPPAAGSDDPQARRIAITLSDRHRAMLRDMAETAGLRPAALAASLVAHVLEDDAAAHGASSHER